MDTYDDRDWVSKVKFVQGDIEQAKSIEKVLTLNWRKNQVWVENKRFIELFHPLSI